MQQDDTTETPDPAAIDGTLEFLRLAERLKGVLRNSRGSDGRPESTAEHSWRLALMAMAFAPDEVDVGRLLKICLVHDLAEALTGDIPAPLKRGDKAPAERLALREMTATLPPARRAEILALWEEYEAAATPEAVLAKGFDKLETILQHLQGANPPGFDHGFNLGYGRRATDAHPLLAAIRESLDAGTRALTLPRTA
jgi:putative hydrolase of HD superfamily